MKKLLLASTMLIASAGIANAEMKVGVILGFTGPIETLTPAMGAAAELAMSEASVSGKFLGGETVTSVRADSTCIDAAAATAAAERLIGSEGVAAIMGADCSGVTTAILNNTAKVNGVTMISPSATSPALSTVEDNGFFFRTAPSDARQGQVIADIMKDQGITDMAITYTNNDYGKGLADAFQAAFEANGGTVSVVAPHEDGKADYSAEVGALSAGGSETLAVFGYVDQGGKGIIEASIDTDAFGQFIMGDGMIGDSLMDALGADMTGSIGVLPGADEDTTSKWVEYSTANGVAGDGPFSAQSYDAAALIILAAQAAGSMDRAGIAANVMSVANAPGEKIGAGELGKALEILAAGGEVDYQGASGVELIGPGEAAGLYEEKHVEGGAFNTVGIR